METRTNILTIKEVAAILRCSRTHVSNMIKGKVPGAEPLEYLAMGRRILIRREWLDSWMEAHKSRC